MNEIVVVGLGPGDIGDITLKVWEILNQTEDLYVRTNTIRVLDGLPSKLRIHSFDDYYQENDDYDTIYSKISEKIINIAEIDGKVVYGVPGDPYVAETTTRLIMEMAKSKGIKVEVVNGISFLEPILRCVGMDLLPNTVALDAFEVSSKLIPPHPPNFPAIISQIYSREIASNLKLTLMNIYPDDHQVKLVHNCGTKAEMVEEIRLFEIDRSNQIGLTTALYLPPLDDESSFESFLDVIAVLRSPDGCPWDRNQDHQSLRPFLLEETYELLEALDSNDEESILDELGDLLIQILLHAQISSEEGEFNIVDVVRNVNRKLVNRHPHVFGDVEVDGTDDVLHNWTRIKEEKNISKGKGVLSGVPKTLPSLYQSQLYQERAAKVGFDWESISDVSGKILEEISEVVSAETPEDISDELGDLLFALVNYVRWKKLDAESILREANKRFRRRFEYIERNARERSTTLSNMSLDEMETYWIEAKNLEDNSELR